MNTWMCSCGFNNPEDLPTNKRYLRCAKCGRKFIVQAHHVDGSPMLAEVSGPTPTKSRTIRVSEESKARLIKIQRHEGLNSLSDALVHAIHMAEAVQSLQDAQEKP